MMYGMRRTTIYLTESLKAELARAAAAEGRTEADLIREGVEQLLRSRNPEPRLPLFESGQPDLAENVDSLLAGFGER
jgi:Ribbon-helix-helix protein, copG family